MKKVLFIIIDGLGDRPIKELNNCTPLEYAKTPNLDSLASNSQCGMMYTLGVGVRPSSDVAHMTLFGLDYQQNYTGRGPIELIGLGVEMGKKDLAFRGNFAVVDSEHIILDRRAKRQSPNETILNSLKSIKIDSVEFKLHHIAEHRFALQMIGEQLSPNVTDSDPHIENVKTLEVLPTANNNIAKFTANVLNKYIEKVNDTFKQLSFPSEANAIILRGGGERPEWNNFNKKYGFSLSCCVTNNALYNGIGTLLGMNVVIPKRFDNYKKYYKSIAKNVEKSLESSDFVFLHIQEADLYGEDGDSLNKYKVIEEIDTTLSFLNKMNDDVLIVLTSDHSTPCGLKAHSGDSVPIMIHGNGVRYDDVKNFNEKSCVKGGLGTIFGKDLMQIIINQIGRAELIGN